MAIVEIASRRASTEAGNFDSTNLAFPGAISVGDLLVAVGTTWATATHTNPVTDSLGHTYSVLQGADLSGNGGVYKTFIAYKIATSAGTPTVTINPSVAGAYGSFSVDAFSGVDSSTPLDVDGGSNTRTAVAAASDSITTLTANDLIVAVMSHDISSSSPTLTPNGSYTQIGEIESTANAPHNAVFLVVTTATSYTPDWTIGVLVDHSIAQTAAFKEAAAGGGASRPMFRGV